MKSIQAKKILTKTKNRNWFGTDYNMNIYRGCHHGCIYCDSRSECYQIDDFDQVSYKENALELLNQELQGKRSKGVIGFGAMSDAYNHLEKKQFLTVKALGLIDAHGFGVSLATKSRLVERDIEQFKSIQQHSPVNIGFSFCTSHDRLASKIERNVSLPSERFEALAKCKESGLYSGVLLMPVLPYITDNWKLLADLVLKAKNAGADYIYPLFGMTLRDRQKNHYFDSLEKLSPEIAEKYRKNFKDTYFFPAENYEYLNDSFKNMCTKLSISYEMTDIIEGYQKSYQMEQGSLF
ncbi:SPL family radical SAM protein [Enterococcus larvae]|uniref:SPL family radical SAM protein n=1 Tax=Enterococcus larvae TaxID=2794352 RepID=UPI003F3FC18F